VYLTGREPQTTYMRMCCEEVLARVDSLHNISVFDHDKPLAPQFEGVEVVVDFGGIIGTREMGDASVGSVRLWQILGTGIDHFELDYWKSLKIPVSNTPGPFSATALGECAMMFILMLARGYAIARKNLFEGLMFEPFGMELEGLRLGIVGFGASGKELARRAKVFGLKVSAIDTRDVGEDEVEEYGLDFAGKLADLDRVIAESDILSVHLPLNEETHHIVDGRRLALMKPTAFLINVACGALVDETALADALVESRIAGAGLDAYGQEPPDITSPLFNLPNVYTTPHIAGQTDGTTRKRAQAIAENVDRLAAGLEPLYRVDQ